MLKSVVLTTINFIEYLEENNELYKIGEVMLKILVGSPIQQDPDILKEFLVSLTKLEQDDIILDYCFVDDNIDEESKKILDNFRNLYKDKVIILNSSYKLEYVVDDYTHRWSQRLIEKVTEFKNKIIEVALNKQYDYLFFIDSDIVLHPKTLSRLVKVNKEIVANIFWTKWGPDSIELPQVWLKDAYTMYDFMTNEPLTHLEIQEKTIAFLQMLRSPGTYKVGGLGACTLINKSALSKGVNFSPVYNISFWGEDRHFCIRAASLGIQLWVDTYYPAFHLYRKENLGELENYKVSCINRDIEILGNILAEKAVRAIEKANSYGFDEKIDKSFLDEFEEQEGKRLLEQYNNGIEDIIKNKLIKKTKVLHAKVEFQNNNDICIIEVVYSESGYKNNMSFYKEYIGQIILRETESQWKILKWILLREKLLDKERVVRKVENEPNKVTLSMLVKDTTVKYLSKSLTKAAEYIDEVVIYDITTNSDIEKIAKEVLENIPYKIKRNNIKFIGNESEIRKEQWNETILLKPQWMIFLDADEIFEDEFKNHIENMKKNRDIDAYIFSVYEFWDEMNFRSDELWNSHNSYKAFMIRYQENFEYKFDMRNIMCERVPINTLELEFTRSLLRIKKYELSDFNNRLTIYKDLICEDPDGVNGDLNKYKSILDNKQNLVRWSEKV